jgi:hypothetical protein
VADTYGNSGDVAPVRDEADADQAAKAEDSRREQILDDARKRLRLAEEAERDIRTHALSDLEFLTGKQWHEVDRAEREAERRPCLIVNRLPQLVQQVTNDQRQNRPSIKIHPLDNAASIETAEIIQGLVRHIQYISDAESARDTAFEAAARASFGYYRIRTDYVSPDSFDQEIFVERIRNQFAAFLDPYAQKPDGSDANWGFIIDDVSPEDYKAQFPDSKLADKSEWELVGNTYPDWVRKDGARVVEYYYREYQDATIHLLSTGVTIRDEELAAHLAQAQATAPNLNVTVVNTRKTKIPVIKHCKLNAIEILEETVWPGKYIPIIPVYGTEYYFNGKRILEGLIRNAKDPQRMLNYWKSAQTEAIALAPRAPFIGYEGQFEGHEQKWKTANRKNHAYLEVKATTLNGQPAPLPQRSAVEPAVQAITQASMEAADDIKGTTGVFDAGVGNVGPEVSGIAIKRRNNQIQTSNFHLTDNLSRAIRYEGRILVDLIPKIYDTARAARIIGEDGTHQVVLLNQKHQDPDTGKDVLYDVTVGRYDVTVDTGPSYASKREEAAAAMIDLSSKMPQMGAACPDLIVKNMDWPGSQEMADRLRMMLPPQLQNDGKQPEVPPQALALLQQQHAMIGQLQQNLSEATKVIETKKLELEHKERMGLLDQQTQIGITLAKIGAQSNIELLKQEVGALKHESQLLQEQLQAMNFGQPIDAPNDFDPNQADGGNYAGAGHIGGSANLTGEASPGQTPGENP